MYALGIKPTMNSEFDWWGYHDPSACLLQGGKIVAAAEEERFTREKFAPRPTFPKQSIEYVLSTEEIGLDDVDVIGIGRDQRRWKNRLLATPREFVPDSFSIKTVYNGFQLAAKVFFAELGYPLVEVGRQLEEIFGVDVTDKLVQRSHHQCHAASARYSSGFDRPVTITIDAFGEDDSTVVWDPQLNRIKTFRRPNSVGLFYAAIGRYLGFRGHRDAGKVMGLAAYGGNDPEIAKVFANLTSIGDGDYDVTEVIDGQGYSDHLERVLGPSRNRSDPLEPRHENIAHHLQQRTIEIVTEIVRHYTSELNTSSVCLAGGVAMNCKLNTAILDLPCVDKLFVQPVANDTGISLGAAFEAYRRERGEQPNPELRHLFLGPEYDNSYVERHLENSKLDSMYSDHIWEDVADLLVDNNIVGWFQGRMEFGRRALGNRSILANPTSDTAKELVNSAVKNREQWRPFAPSLLHDRRDEYLVRKIESPYMILTDKIQPEKRSEIPAVTHVDGTARPQTVRETVNGRFYRLIESFGRKTGTPVVLNTSLNVSGEPIVESPKQAISLFMNTGLDALAIGDYLLTKSS